MSNLNYFDNASVDNNSGMIRQLYVKDQDVLALYYASREALWARAHSSTCVHGQEYRHRQGGLEVLRQETPQIGIRILNKCTQNLPSALQFRMPR